ncbi:monocarboxylate transporter 7-like isoform X1 [Schistocerca serialis cubense]|uniref:monocarboxylate transporter 7-like isoform X1 n=1 Tax=Schistocerca serialis cubense TaxID=2023355 RepID=UPI00214E200D|nr:monocarboxylate transporter 7-like isoform X1 [Schistocerca serialis cubense]
MAVDAEAAQQQWGEEAEGRLQPEQERLLESAEEARPAVTARAADAAGGHAQAARGQQQQQPPAPQAPDGGWSWLVAAAVAFICTATMGPALTSPFVFADYLEEIGQGSQGMTTLLSVWMATSSLSGLFCNKLFQRFSCRQVGWIGAVIMAIGQGPVAFATAFWHFILANICGGLGMGLVVTACFTGFNIYFHRRKTFAMGFTQLAMGLGIFGFPMLVQHLVDSFGFRMAQCIICAINMSIIPVFVILRPLQKRSPGKSADKRSSASRSTEFRSGFASQRTDISKSLSVDHINERNAEEQNLNGDKFNMSLNHLTTRGRSLNDKEMTSTERKEHHRDGGETQQKQPSHHSAGTLNSQIQPSRPASSLKDSPSPRAAAGRNTRRWWSAVVDLFDLTLMQDFSIANSLVGISLIFFVDMMFMTVIPLYLFNTGLSRNDAALAMSVMTFSDMAGRLSMAIIGACGVTKNRLLFLLGSTACVSFRTMIIFFVEFTPIVVLSVLMGFSRSYVTSTMPLVIGETCSKERFPAAYGLHQVMSGILYITIGPLIGLLKDITNSFVASIATLDVIALLCIVSWILEIIVTYKRKRDKLAPNM